MNKLLSIIVVLYVSVGIVQPSREENNNNDWDILTFTQAWPETVCKEWVKRDPSHTCNLPKQQDAWGIHGIWPDKFHTRGPEFCNRSWHFDPEQIRPIETQLMERWTNVEGETEKYSFWAHEWTKHGTCAAKLESLNSEYKYFSMGLELYQKYNMASILAKSGIVPDNNKPYDLMAIYNAVRGYLNVNPSIQCRKEDGKSYIVEIRICIDKSLQLCNFDAKDMIKYYPFNLITNCDASQGIYYPHSKWPLNNLYVNLYKLVSWLQWFTL